MLKVVKSGACMAMVIAISLVVGATVFNTAHAEDPYQDAGVGYTVNVAPSLKVTLSSNNVVLNLNPNTHTSDSGDLDISVSTNNATGYTMTMASTGDATALSRNSTADGKTASIPTLSAAAGTTPASLTDNTWGYKLSETDNFIPYVSGTQIMDSSSATNNDEATVSFASKINYSQAAGTYSLGLTLAAVSNPPISYLQDVTNATCPTTPTIAVDKRDNQEYVIQRLEDGRCWMMDNLNLGATDTLAVDQLDSSNTNFTGSNASNTIPASTFLSSTWKKTSGSNSYINPEYIPITASNSTTGSDTDPTSNTKYGTLYNYCAASAQTYCYGSDSGTMDVVLSDLCPTGWRLPDGRRPGEFKNLYEQPAYNTLAKIRKAYASSNGGAAFAFAGGFSAGAPANQGSIGRYWSINPFSSEYIFDFMINTSSVTTSGGLNRSAGFSIRCILKDTRNLSNISTMQDVNHDIVVNTAIGVSKTLTDVRDSKQYTVARLADGNVWMTSNLNIAGGTKLYSDTSNVPSGYPTSAGVSYYTLPSSSRVFSSDTVAYVYNSGNETTLQSGCTSAAPCNSYYSWLAATVGGKRGTQDATSNGDMATYSICPSSWELPLATIPYISRDNNGYIGGDFYRLAVGYGMSSNNYWQSTTSFNSQVGPNTVPNFLLAGYYSSGSSLSGGGSNALYWSSTSYSSSQSYVFDFDSSAVNTATNLNRRSGLPVRCITK